MFIRWRTGLIKNLDEVIAEIKKYENRKYKFYSICKKVLSQVLEDPEIIYIEHLILDFYEDRIEKLGNYDWFEPK